MVNVYLILLSLDEPEVDLLQCPDSFIKVCITFLDRIPLHFPFFFFTISRSFPCLLEDVRFLGILKVPGLLSLHSPGSEPSGLVSANSDTQRNDECS